MVADAEVSTAETEMVYQTGHFEARPFREGYYCIVHKGTDNPACGREFPAEVAKNVVEAMEEGYQWGIGDLLKAVRDNFGEYASGTARDIQRASLPPCEVFRPKT